MTVCRECGYIDEHDDDCATGLRYIVDDLADALNGLLDGLDSNSTQMCEGLSQEQWNKRIETARKVLDDLESSE